MSPAVFSSLAATSAPWSEDPRGYACKSFVQPEAEGAARSAAPANARTHAPRRESVCAAVTHDDVVASGRLVEIPEREFVNAVRLVLARRSEGDQTQRERLGGRAAKCLNKNPRTCSNSWSVSRRCARWRCCIARSSAIAAESSGSRRQTRRDR
jgi:hypothetical protein